MARRPSTLWVTVAALAGCGPSPVPPPDGSAPAPSSAPVRPAVGPPLQGAVQIALGDTHSCVRKKDGTAWCWGDGSFGQLGDGTTTSRAAPGPVAGLNDAVEIAVGAVHNCARTASGAVRCWGKNGLGQLGDGTTTDRLEPVAVVALTAATQIALSTTARTCATLGDATIRCWGNTSWTVQASRPALTPVAVPPIDEAAQVALGWGHGCARRKDGAVRCWGNNLLGACGDGGAELEISNPVPVAGLADVAEIALGAGHGCAVGKDKKVRCWGSNKNGKLGDGTSENRRTPVLVADLDGVEHVALGSDHSCAWATSGEVLCWGSNEFRQLGDGTTVGHPKPVRVAELTGVTQVAAGANHTCALLAEGRVACWGRNQYDQLGFSASSTCGPKREPCATRPALVRDRASTSPPPSAETRPTTP